MKCLPNILHWHGAAPNEKFIQIAITNTEMSATVWLQVTTLTYRTLESIRGFLKYAYKEKLIEQELAMMVPKYNYNRQPKFPSFYLLKKSR